MLCLYQIFLICYYVFAYMLEIVSGRVFNLYIKINGQNVSMCAVWRMSFGYIVR